MKFNLAFYLMQLRKRLWVKPLIYCLLAVLASLLAMAADFAVFGRYLPDISPDTIETLLKIISSSMLAVATFAVGSMIASYASASDAATPRAFALVLADDVSQTALSSFIGAFIFSIVSIVTLKTGLYERGGLFVLFVLTLAIFGWVVLTFVRWVDNIARLGRLGTAIDKAEAAARNSMEQRRKNPWLGGVAKTGANALEGAAVYSPNIGYVQHIDMQGLQSLADEHDLRMMVETLPGTFVAPGRAVVLLGEGQKVDEELAARIARKFVIGDDRTFEEDPRFGLIVLSEIAARALSPAVNDAGTAIVIIGRFVRLFAGWAKALDDALPEARHDRIIVPALDLGEMFDDAFTALARDGAGNVEAGIRLQKAFVSLSALGQADYIEQARRHARLALGRAETALTLPEDMERLRRIAGLLEP